MKKNDSTTEKNMYSGIELSDAQVIAEQNPDDMLSAKLNTQEKAESQDSDLVAQNKNEMDWFILLNDNSNNQLVLDQDDFKNEIRNGLVDGTLNSENEIEGHFKNDAGEWEKEDTTVKKFTKDFAELRMLYDPIWNHAKTGLKWGAFIGIGLKLIDTSILLGSVDPLYAFLFLGAIGICFIPNIGIVGAVIAGFLLARYTGMNFFLMAISASLTGATLGFLPGMFLGGLIGLLRRDTIPKAHDALHEPPVILFKAILLPFLGAVGLIYVYIFHFNPWLISVLQ